MNDVAQRIRDAINGKKVLNEYVSTGNSMLDAKLNNNVAEQNFYQFKRNVRATLLCEALAHKYENLVKDTAGKDYIFRIVESFVKTEGAENLLEKMKVSSNLLSEMVSIIDKHTDIILREAEEEKKEAESKGENVEYSIPEEKSKNFVMDISVNTDKKDVDDKIKEKVKEAISDFVTDMNKKQDDIKAAIDDTSEKINRLMPEGLKKDDELESSSNEDGSNMEDDFVQFDDDGNVMEDNKDDNKEESTEEVDEDNSSNESPDNTEESKENEEDDKEKKVSESTIMYHRRRMTKDEKQNLANTYNRLLEGTIRDIRGRHKTLLEHITHTLSKEYILSESTSEINMKDIINEASNYYTFLEMLNSYNIMKFDKENIKKYI